MGDPPKGSCRGWIEAFVLVAVRVYGEGIVDAAERDRRFRVTQRRDATSAPANGPTTTSAPPRGRPDRMGLELRPRRRPLRRIRKDTRGPEPDPMTKRILEPNNPGRRPARLPRMLPGLLLRHPPPHPGAGGGAAGITDITYVQFSVTFALTTDRRT